MQLPARQRKGMFSRLLSDNLNIDLNWDFAGGRVLGNSPYQWGHCNKNQARKCFKTQYAAYPAQTYKRRWFDICRQACQPGRFGSSEESQYNNLNIFHQRLNWLNGNWGFVDQFRFKAATSFFESLLSLIMKPPFGFQNAPMKHLSSIVSFKIILLIGISAILGGS